MGVQVRRSGALVVGGRAGGEEEAVEGGTGETVIVGAAGTRGVFGSIAAGAEAVKKAFMDLGGKGTV